jgi:hypothetical protein
MAPNEIRYNPATSTFFVSSWLRFEKSSYAKHALAYRINRETYTPQAGKSGTLSNRKGKSTIVKLKPPRLSNNVAVNPPSEITK